MEPKKQSFWTILLGILTGGAALITIITGVYVVFKPPATTKPNESVKVSNQRTERKKIKPPKKSSRSSMRVTGTDKSKRKSIEVFDGDLLAIKESSGIAVVSFDHKIDCKATYKWRFKPRDGSHETSGIGELYEQYGKVNDDNKVEDVGGRLLVFAGPYEIQWSCSGQNSGWVYSNDRVKNLSIFKSKNIKDFKL